MSGKIYQNRISLYFHVPFCKKKCDYCHFYVIPDKEPHKLDYMEGLRAEWQLRKKEIEGKEVCSIYFGGGTPSLLGPHFIEEILSWIGAFGEMEITLEANPDDVSAEFMRQYALAGINRVSIGVQSLDDSLLAVLSRKHDSKKAIDAIFKVQEAGIGNISLDLMYDIPHQTLSQWEATLEEAIRLPVTHLSLYNLVFEPQTVFFKKRSALKCFLPEESDSTKMYQMAVSRCSAAGFNQYEISAFEKPGFFSRHNIGYWQGRPFLGFGPSAFSYWEGKRFRNVANLGKYLRALKSNQSPVDFEEELKGRAKIRELFAINLRLLEGVDLKAFEKSHGMLDQDLNGLLSDLGDRGLLVLKGGRAQLTGQGILFYDEVAGEIV